MPTNHRLSETDLHPTHIHTIYGMRCAEYDALIERAAGGCELCLRPWRAADKVRPQIDHDHAAGDDAVRGIVCARCNAHMRRIDSGERVADEATVAYLERAWWRTERRS